MNYQPMGPAARVRMVVDRMGQPVLWQYKQQQAEWEANAGEETWDPSVVAPRCGRVLPARPASCCQPVTVTPQSEKCVHSLSV